MNQEQEKIEELTVEQPTEEKCNCENCECHHDKKKKKNKNKKEEELTLKIAELEKLNQELTDKVKLAQAELVNYRRRKDEETANMLKYSNQNLIMEILPILDNFERAIKLDDSDLTDELSKGPAATRRAGRPAGRAWLRPGGTCRWRCRCPGRSWPW